MMTLEQYLQVARMWYAEQHDEFNPFEGDFDILNDEGDIIKQGPEYKVADDGWVDYADDGINTIADKQNTEVQFDQNAFNQSQIDMAKLAAVGNQKPAMNQSTFVMPG